jgi:Ca2+-binding EF-hand superfamily protein
MHLRGAQMMKTMDVDNNGQLDYMEFVAATMSAYQMAHGLSPAHNAQWLNRVRVVFDKIDEDGNGYITQQVPLQHLRMLCCAAVRGA